MANLVLKPQVTAFLDVVTTATGPDLHMAEIEVPASSAHAGKTIRDMRVRHETGAMIVALRKRDGTFDTTPEPDAMLEPGDVLVGVGTTEELRRLEELFAPADPLATDPVRDLAAALGPEVVLERPSDPAHGDYATNVALKLAGARRRPPRELAAELAEEAGALPGVERTEIAGPGFVNLFLDDAWFSATLAAILDAGASFGGGWADPTQRIQVEMVSANPTGPITVASARNGAYGDSLARLLELGGNDVEREYYYNDSGAQMDRFRASVEAARRGEEPPEDGYHGDYVAELAKEDGDPVPAMREADRGVARALPDPLRLVGEPERDRAARRRAAAEARHVRGRRDAVGAHDGARRRQGPAADPLLRRLVPLLRRRRRVRQGQVRPRLRHRDLRARRRPPRLRRAAQGGRARCSATTRIASRCCSTSSCI